MNPTRTITIPAEHAGIMAELLRQLPSETSKRKRQIAIRAFEKTLKTLRLIPADMPVSVIGVGCTALGGSVVFVSDCISTHESGPVLPGA